MKKMIRTFHPVGHGAFYTERFYEGNKNIANVVFDCGCCEFSKDSTCQNRIDKMIRNVFTKDTEIDALFISHFHVDHINGITELIKHCKIGKIYIPYLAPVLVVESYIYNYITTGKALCQSNKFLKDVYSKAKQDDSKIEEINEQKTQQKITVRNVTWVYIPFTSPTSKSKQMSIEKELKNKLSPQIFTNSNTINFEELKKSIESAGVDKCKEIYTDIYKDNHNSYSLLLFSGRGCLYHCKKMCKSACLYTGDFKAKGKFNSAKKYYEDLLDSVGILQVPHHGSEKNINKGLYKKGRIHVISAGVQDYYHHPDNATLLEIQSVNGVVHLVTEDPSTELKFAYDFL